METEISNLALEDARVALVKATIFRQRELADQLADHIVEILREEFEYEHQRMVEEFESWAADQRVRIVADDNGEVGRWYQKTWVVDEGSLPDDTSFDFTVQGDAVGVVDEDEIFSCEIGGVDCGQTAVVTLEFSSSEYDVGDDMTTFVYTTSSMVRD